MKLQLCLAVLVTTVGVLHSTPENLPPGISEDTLKGESAEALSFSFFFPQMSSSSPPFSFSPELSANGEKLVDDEVRRALYGVKQMREVMWRNARKHEHLMASLMHSGEKKRVRRPHEERRTSREEIRHEVCSLGTGGGQAGKGGD